MLRAIKNFFEAFAVVVLVAYVVLLLKNRESADFSSENKIINRLESVQFSTDGTISSRWLAERLKIKRGCDLFKLDISAMRNNLLSIQQIVDVDIEKFFPNTLSIRIKERTPIFKFFIADGASKKLMFVDKYDGAIYEPVDDVGSVASGLLPVNFLLKRNKEHEFLPINGISNIVSLLEMMNEKIPEIFSMIKCVDLRSYDARHGAIWSRIKFDMKNGITAVLGNDDFMQQITHLEYMMNERCRNDLHRIKRIDMSPINDAVVEYK